MHITIKQQVGRLTSQSHHKGNMYVARVAPPPSLWEKRAERAAGGCVWDGDRLALRVRGDRAVPRIPCPKSTQAPIGRMVRWGLVGALARGCCLCWLGLTHGG
jgi:hypothetical protein